MSLACCVFSRMALAAMFHGLDSEALRRGPQGKSRQLRAGYACRSRAFACELANVRMVSFFSAHDACALQMTRKRGKSESQKENLSKATLAATAKREEKRAKATAEASLAAAPADSGTDPPPAGRFRRSCCTPTAQCTPSRHGHCSSGRRRRPRATNRAAAHGQ